MKKQANSTGKVHQLYPDKTTRIDPLDGWDMQTKYGTLRLDDGADCVRLQDVHTWLLRDGAPASEVGWKMFRPLLDAAREACEGAFDAARELAACKLLGSLHLVCADKRPVKIFAGRKWCKWGKARSECENMQVRKARDFGSGDTWFTRYVPYLTFMRSDHVEVFRSNFPGLGHHRFEDDTPAGLIYGMAEGVVRVWRGPVDAATDPVLMDSIKKDRAEEDEYRIEWPSDDVLSLALERVAVPIAIAYELWGWGRVVYEAKAQAAPAITPPAWWRVELDLDHGRSKARYFQKADANTPLVRIVDVLADFAARQGLPNGEAVGDFLAAVNVPLLQEVYELRENHFAELVGKGFMYGLDTQADAEAQSVRLHGVKDASRGLYPWAANPHEAFKRHIQEHGPQRSDRSLYAVSHATANRLWGWGSVVAAERTQTGAAMDQPLIEAVNPKKVKEKDKSPEWTGQRLHHRREELKRQGVKNFAASVAKEAGLEETEARRRVRNFKNGGAMVKVANQLVKNRAA